MAEDPYKYFRIEARELGEQLHRGVLELERAGASAELLSRLFRAAHTLKGAARVVKQPRIADLSHALEDLLAPLRDGNSSLGPDGLARMLELVDGIAVLVAELDRPEGAPGGASGDAKAAPAAEASRPARADSAEVDALVEGLAEANARLGVMRESLATLGHARDLAGLVSAQLGARRGGSDRASAGAIERARSALDELSSSLAATDRGLSRSIEETGRELRQARSAAEGLLLLPVSQVFTVLERSARDAAQTVGRRVRVETRGGEVRLEADVLSAVQGALVQIVRNAVAHGIEPEAQRVATGKPAVGVIRCEARRRGNRVSFTCADDGRGIDVEAVRRAAAGRGRGAVSAGKLAADELTELLLRGGITTAGRVDGVAGRGVGLDVVREAAERLRGRIRITSEAGKGTSVELDVPVSLAAFDALLVDVAGETAALPLDAVRGAALVRERELVRDADGLRMVHGGQTIAFEPLASVLGLPAPATREAWPCLIVEGVQRHAALGADRLLGTAQIVLRPLPRYAPAHPVVAGVALDAEGVPRLVLDPDGCVAAALVPRRAPSPQAKERAPVLVIDDSVTTRMLEQSILESAGYEVELASSAEEGLEKARARPHALFLVDVEMPGMNGFEFVELTRADPVLRVTPAILVTSRDAAEDRARGKRAGAAAYVVKSEFDQVALLEQIERLSR